jgi:hypothetical protein
MAIKFHEKAVVIYGTPQVADGVSAVNATPTGTITTTVASAAVTGQSTLFTTECAVGQYMYHSTGIVGRIKTITSNTAIVLEDAVPATATVQAEGVMAKATAVTTQAFTLGLGPKNALAVLNLNYSTELTTEAIQYVGNELDRSEANTVTDKYGKFDCEVLLPALGTIAGTDPVLAEIPMADWFQSSGLAPVLSTGSAGYVKYTNSVNSNTYLTIEVRRSSPDLTLEQKTFTLTDCRGTVDLDAKVGTKPRIKLSYLGNLATVVDKFSIVPDYGDQKNTLAPAIRSTTITTAQLSPYTSSDTVEPAYSAATKNVCFDKINAPNLSGFDYTRYLTGCADGWGKGAIPTDVTLTILEDKAAATYNPDNQIEMHHALYVDFGTVTGFKVRLVYHNLQLAKVSNSKVANYAGQDLGLRNTGTFDLYLL